MTDFQSDQHFTTSCPYSTIGTNITTAGSMVQPMFQLSANVDQMLTAIAHIFLQEHEKVKVHVQKQTYIHTQTNTRWHFQ